MPIPVEYANRPLYHFTHIENLPGILEYGILSTNERRHRGIAHKNVAYDNIQDRRSVMEVLCGCGGVVHDYVPLYFCKRSPMLYAILQSGIIDQKQIIYLEFPIQILEQYQSVFTDASANTLPPPRFYDDTSKLTVIDWKAIDTWKWGQQYDTGEIPVTQKKQAEVLIHKVLPIDSLKRVVAYDQHCMTKAEKIFKERGVVLPTIVSRGRGYYY